MRSFLALILMLSSVILMAIHPVDRQSVEWGKVYLPIMFKPGGAPPTMPVLQWAYGGCNAGYCDTGWYSSPVVMDLDQDGEKEIIAAQEYIYFLKGGNGQVKYLPYPLSGRSWPSIAGGDFNLDGQNEIVAADGNGWLYLFTYRPSLQNYEYLWVKTEDNCANGACYEVRSLAVDDLDGDGLGEIMTASTRSQYQWRVYQIDGSNYPGSWPQHGDNTPENGYAAGCYNENIAASDLDQDGRGEIVGTSDVHYITMYEDDGAQIRANVVFGLNPDSTRKYWSAVGVHLDHQVDLRGYANCSAGELRPNFAGSAPTIADVNGDGQREIIVVGNIYNCVEPYTDLYSMPYIFNSDRTRWQAGNYDWTILPPPSAGMEPLSEDYSVIENAVPNPVVVDLDGDGLKEILYPAYDGKLHAYWLDKTEHGDWPVSVYRPEDGYFQFASEPAVVDFERDGLAEVIFTTWTQKGSHDWGSLYIVKWDGSVLFKVDLPEGDHNANWNGSLGAPTIDNIDADSNYEIALNTAHSGIVAYELPNSSGMLILWQTGRGGYTRSGSQ